MLISSSMWKVPLSKHYLCLHKLSTRTQVSVDHNICEIRLRVYLPTFVYSKSVSLRNEIFLLFTHFNYFSLVTWHYPRPLSSSLCRSEQYHFIYKFSFYHAAAICIYVGNLPFFLPLYNLEHCQKCHLGTKDVCWCGKSVGFVDLDSSQHSFPFHTPLPPPAPHLISLISSRFFFGWLVFCLFCFLHKYLHHLPKPYILDNIKIFIPLPLLQKGENQPQLWQIAEESGDF